MINVSERFLMEWIHDNIDSVRHDQDELLIVERLLLKLENDAGDVGLDRTEFLDAVGGDPYGFVRLQIKEALWRESQGVEHPAGRAPYMRLVQPVG